MGKRRMKMAIIPILFMVNLGRKGNVEIKQIVQPPGSYIALF
jgi:hypothetical protein